MATPRLHLFLHPTRACQRMLGAGLSDRADYGHSRRLRGLVFAGAAASLVACAAGPTTRGESGSDPRDEAGLTGNENMGRIVGTVTIGPLCPVERIPPDPACAPRPELFAQVQVVIRRPDGETVRRVELDDHGNYFVELEPGTYLVDVDSHGIGIGVGDPGVEDSVSSASGWVEPDSGWVTQTDSGWVEPEDSVWASAADSVPWWPMDSFPSTMEGSPSRETGDPHPHHSLPVSVELARGEIERVDIDIDTGIR